MQKYTGACSPDQVHILQEICDVVMRELRANGTISRSEDVELLRDVIARRESIPMETASSGIGRS
jgi:hypothetical protein